MCDDFDWFSFFFLPLMILFCNWSFENWMLRKWNKQNRREKTTKRERHTSSSSIHIILLGPSSLQSNSYEIELIVFFSVLVIDGFNWEWYELLSEWKLDTKTWAQINREEKNQSNMDEFRFVNWIVEIKTHQKLFNSILI